MTQPEPQISGKISFAVDFINVLGLMNLRAKSGMNPISHSAILLFLIDWGLSAAELDRSNQLFWQQVDNKSIDNFDVAAKRIVKALENHPEEQRRIMVQLAAIAELDADLTPDEVSYFKNWGEMFDMRPSEVTSLYDRGRQLAMALTFFGRKYMETRLAEAARPAAADAPAAGETPAPPAPPPAGEDAPATGSAEAPPSESA